MNAANVMAISPKAGAVSRVQSTRNVGNAGRASVDMPRDSFGEALANAGEEVTAKMAKSPLEGQGSTQENVAAKEADIKDDMPEGTEAAMNNQQQGKEPKTGKEMTRDGETATQGVKAKESEKVSVGEDEAGKMAAPAVLMNFTTEGKAALVMEEEIPEAVELPQQAEPTAKVNLQSLLPQTGEDVQKNKNFLAMLSGQQVKPLEGRTEEKLLPVEIRGQKAVNPNQQAGGVPGNWQMLKPATMLDAQLSNHQLANQSILQETNIVPNPNLLLSNAQEMGRGYWQNEAINNAPLLNQTVSQGEQSGTLPLVNQVFIQTVHPMERQTAPPLAQMATETGRQVSTAVERPLQATQLVGAEAGNRINMDIPVQMVTYQANNQASGQIAVENVVENNLMEQDSINNLQTSELNNGKERQDAKGMAPFEQSKETMPSTPVGKVNDSAAMQEAGRVMISEGAVLVQPRSQNAEPQLNNPLAGASITVEDEVPVMAVSAKTMQDNPQQDLAGQRQQPVIPDTEVVKSADGETVTQLAEEAVGDKAPQSDTARPTANSAVSMFQQSLNESLTGTKESDAANPLQNRQDDFDVPRQIVEQARLLRRGEDTQMVIKLHPDHLGELTLKVSVSANGAVNASFYSDNAQVRTIIENTLVQLKQELNNQGLKVDNVDVYAGLTDGQLPQGEGQQAWQQNQRQNSNTGIRNTGNVDDYGEETENIAVSAQSAADVADGVDYRV